MRPTKPPGGVCPNDRDSCPLQCKYNHFESPDLTIHAWELKCLDCGWRDTVGFRSDEDEDEDEDEPDEDCEPDKCPFCQLKGLAPGQNPCETIEPNSATSRIE